MSGKIRAGSSRCAPPRSGTGAGPWSGPASSSTTSLLVSSDSREATTQPAVPPPMTSHFVTPLIEAPRMTFRRREATRSGARPGEQRRCNESTASGCAAYSRTLSMPCCWCAARTRHGPAVAAGPGTRRRRPHRGMPQRSHLRRARARPRDSAAPTRKWNSATVSPPGNVTACGSVSQSGIPYRSTKLLNDRPSQSGPGSCSPNPASTTTGRANTGAMISAVSIARG